MIFFNKNWLKTGASISVGGLPNYYKVIGMQSNALYSPQLNTDSWAFFNGEEEHFLTHYNCPPRSFSGNLSLENKIIARGYGYQTDLRFIPGELIKFENWNISYPNKIEGIYKLLDIINDGNTLIIGNQIAY